MTGYDVQRLLVQDSMYSVAIGIPDRPADRVVLIIRYGEDGNPGVRELFALDSTTPDPSVAFFPLQRQERGLAVRYDAVSEGIVGLGVYAIDARQVLKVYSDTSSTICRPSLLRDLDADGFPEIIAYADHPVAHDCLGACSELLARDTDSLDIGVVSVAKWNGARWHIADREFPDFFRREVERYRRLAATLRDSTGRGARCRGIVQPDIAERWIARADSLARRSPR